MHTTMIPGISTFLLSATAFAAPLQSRDTCQYEYLPSLWSVNSQSPAGSNGPITTPLQLYRGSGPTKGETDQFLQFNNVPSTAWGCELQFNYQPNHGGSVTAEQGEPQRIDVYAVNDAIPQPLDWTTAAGVTGSLLTSFRFPTGDDLNRVQVIRIISSVCSPTMRFRLSINDQALGWVFDNLDASSGFRIAHNC